jgi:hypothetical protein
MGNQDPHNHHPIDILPLECRLEEEVGLVLGFVCICRVCSLKVEGFFSKDPDDKA